MIAADEAPGQTAATASETISQQRPRAEATESSQGPRHYGTPRFYGRLDHKRGAFGDRGRIVQGRNERMEALIPSPLNDWQQLQLLAGKISFPGIWATGGKPWLIIHLCSLVCSVSIVLSLKNYAYTTYKQQFTLWRG